MKNPEFNVPGFPYNFDAIPLWIEPDLWNLEVNVHWRRSKLVLLYGLSMIGMATAIFLPIFLYLGVSSGFDSTRALGVWLPWVMTISLAPPYACRLVGLQQGKARSRPRHIANE
ncbi:hypothetical protein [Variovorax sp. KK3]|uniref:hypothetical protein n=1 Tax=Variovorax sp. KK3 TaxID=1855728 RepID=UPI0015C3A1C4|nr:hypothetical protein [Variovorax sp. KK3]